MHYCKSKNKEIHLYTEFFRPSDAGTYWCLAKTGLNTSARRFDIEIRPPKIKPYQRTKADSRNHDDKGYKSGGVTLLFSMITIALIVLSLMCFFLALCYKHRKAGSGMANTRKPSFIATSGTAEQQDAEVLSTKQLLYEDSVHPMLMVTKPSDSDSNLQCHNNITSTDTTSATDIPLEKDESDDKAEKSIGSRTDLCPRKAPLAQYDRDTYVFPIVQTSL